jgi:arabinogalactan endo-1,4-beta-galactosidase
VYARIATRKHVHSGDSEMGFARGLDRARLAKQLGLPFNPELGLFATYGDAGTYQVGPDFAGYPSIRLPGPWHTLTLTQMTQALREYGALVARQIHGTGTRVGMWDIGNEVEWGVAGVTVRPLSGGPYQPVDNVDPAIGQMSVAKLVSMSESDRIMWLRAHLWPYIGRLMAAVAAGIREVERSAEVSTHISGIFEPTSAVPLAFWQAMDAAGFKASAFGTSFYPTAGPLAGPGDRFAWLKSTAATLHGKLRRPMFVAEGDYPSAKLVGAYPYNTPLHGYAQSTSGQAKFVSELIHWGRTTGLLAGFRPWAPDYCTTSWQPMSYFDAHGRAKPVLAAAARRAGISC